MMPLTRNLNPPFRVKNPFLAFLGIKRPLYIAFGLTHRCNVHCRMCNLWQDGDIRREMTIDEINRWADWFDRIGVTTISLGGGEPFLRQDLPDVVRTLTERGIRVRLVTNGIAPTREMIERVWVAGARDVSISLDSLDEETHDYICNKKGAWVKTLENIFHFSEIFDRRGSILMLNTVVSRLNLHEIRKIVDFAGKIGFFVSLIPVHIAGEGEKDLFLAYCPEFSIKKEDYPLLEEVYEDLLRRKRGMRDNIFNSSYFLRQSLRFLMGMKPEWECDAGTLYLSMNPEGKVSACHRFAGENHDDYRSFIDFLRRMKGYEGERLRRGCDGCLRPCWAEISIFFRDRTALLENGRLQLLSFKRRRRLSSCDELIELARNG